MRWIIVVLLGLLTSLELLTSAQARDNGQWSDSPLQIRRWFQELMQPDHPSVSCCGEADAFEADTFEVDGDTQIAVPNEKMKWDAGNPTGHGILFLGRGYTPICYVTPGGV